MAKRSLARAKGRPQQLLIAYLQNPAGQALRVSFKAKTGPANTRTSIYNLRNDLLEALPDCAALFWLPATVKGDPLKLEYRLKALSMRLSFDNTLIIHDGSAYATSTYTILEGAPQLIATRPSSIQTSTPLDEEIAAYEQAEHLKRIETAKAHVRKLKVNLSNPTIAGFIGQPDKDRYEENRQFLIENGIDPDCL